MIGSWWRSCIALSLVACIDEPPSCEAMVCELVPGQELTHNAVLLSHENLRGEVGTIAQLELGAKAVAA